MPLVSKEITNSTRKTKNNILAIPAAAPAIPPKPSTAAISAITINVIDHLSIIVVFWGSYTAKIVTYLTTDNSLIEFNDSITLDVKQLTFCWL